MPPSSYGAQPALRRFVAVDKVSFTVTSGEIFGYLGANALESPRRFEFDGPARPQ